MALCRLTLSWNGNPPVWVNPKNVVSVWSQSDGTMITTNATGKDGTATVYVIENAEVVAQLLDEAERR
jgi:hypothetical protein